MTRTTRKAKDNKRNFLRKALALCVSVFVFQRKHYVLPLISWIAPRNENERTAPPLSLFFALLFFPSCFLFLSFLFGSVEYIFFFPFSLFPSFFSSPLLSCLPSSKKRNHLQATDLTRPPPVSLTAGNKSFPSWQLHGFELPNTTKTRPSVPSARPPASSPTRSTRSTLPRSSRRAWRSTSRRSRR